jgi:hypothetical protein
MPDIGKFDGFNTLIATDPSRTPPPSGAPSDITAVGNNVPFDESKPTRTHPI